ncbi:MAG: putative bifunctional diguanylate cyclase/phosphodiesterase [Pseudomarimonas sp.]
MPRDLLASLLQHPLRDALMVFAADGTLLRQNGSARALREAVLWGACEPRLQSAMLMLAATPAQHSWTTDEALPGQHLILIAARDTSGELLGFSLSCAASDDAGLNPDEREVLLDRAQHMGSMGVWIWRVDRDRFWMSNGAQKIFGLNAAESDLRNGDLGRFVVDRVARHRLRDGVRTAIECGEPYEQEFDIQRPNGVRRRVVARGEALRDPTGKVDRIFGLLQDVTEQRRAEEVAGRRNALLDRIAKIGRIGGWEYNLLTGELDWTDENYRIHGIPVGTPVSVNSTKHMYEGRSREIFEAAVARVVSGERDEETIEVQFITPDEERVWLHIHGQLERRDGKPFRITGHTRDITAEREASERIEQLAHYDTLTGLPNRFQFREMATRAITQTLASNGGLALLFLDLDRFKLVNDTLGHEAGDQLLLDVAGRIRAVVRTGDIVARQSGDEFLVLLRDISKPEDAGRVAAKIIEAVGQPVKLSDSEAQVGCSIGIAVLSADTSTFESLLRAADTAMYAAKEAGRNNYQFYNDAYFNRMQRRVVLERELKQALSKRELRLVYQPTIDLRDGHVRGIEALLRWPRPDGESSTPTEFIPIAEDSGEIIPIGRWVLRQACKQASEWAAAGIKFDRMAVNVSAIQLRDPEFAASVLDACEAAGWPPARLELELTESALMRDSESLRRAFALFEAHGIGLSVDDFGTGFSNLHYLHRFPVKHLKIDRSFVLELLNDRPLERLSQAIVGLGHALGLRVIAEGVETDEVAQRLRSLDCDEAQGFLFARPMTGEALAAWMRGRSNP